MSMWLDIETNEFASDGKWTATIFYDEKFCEENK